MRGAIIINGYPTEKKFFTQGEKIQKALHMLGVETDLVKNGDVYAIMQENGEVRIDKFSTYDFVVYLDKDKYLGVMLEQAGLRLFNRARAVELCDDKASTYLALQGKGLRLAKTIPAPLCYNKKATVNEAFLRNVGEALGFPLVAKTSYGSFGAGVQLVHDMPHLKKVEQDLLLTPHFYQQYVECSKGRDVRVIVVGGKALGGMERVAKGEEFRSNIELGGIGKAIRLDEGYIRAAEGAAIALGLDYCGVDLLEGKEGPVLCEVNSNAFFEGFEQATGIDVAQAYAKHIIDTLRSSVG